MKGGWWLLALLLACLTTRAQTSLQPLPPATTDEVLLSMAAQAAVIFAGHVISIDRADAAGYVDVQFRIDEAVRGCPRTGFYILREWAGLWTGGVERYKVGQRLLMLLHARGPSGLSSPVNGLDGAIALLPGGVAPLARGTGKAPADTATQTPEPLVDLRWVSARTLRATVNTGGGLQPFEPIGAAETVQARSSTVVENAVDKAWVGPVKPIARSSLAVGTGAAPDAVSYSSVMSLLNAGGGGGPVLKPPVRPSGKPLENR
ncbi:hypothetical protein FTO74_01970 [Granulicella sp. WH15]|uniref:hypothetical protein n=1 Tax=Granulicella sp. WH15 TaxID=2602070 RepID=UPI001366812C|nr:hypothetical protein [Granulicella sp. WH15]QHN02275.1 hypothetical protein FTO74_01970 [Granulicella sp. WH15]